VWLTLIVAETISASSGSGYMAMQAREFLLVDVVVLSIRRQRDAAGASPAPGFSGPVMVSHDSSCPPNADKYDKHIIVKSQ
jgi:hypothetical protein